VPESHLPRIEATISQHPEEQRYDTETCRGHEDKKEDSPFLKIPGRPPGEMELNNNKY